MVVIVSASNSSLEKFFLLLKAKCHLIALFKLIANQLIVSKRSQKLSVRGPSGVTPSKV